MKAGAWASAGVFGVVDQCKTAETALRPQDLKTVILSRATASRSEAVAESKDPYLLDFTCMHQGFSVRPLKINGG